MPKNVFQSLIFSTILLVFVIVILGAYVRLSDAGLGCPDWPGCFGKVSVPKGKEQIEQARRSYPESEFDVAKAWKEMVHRYFVGGLGFMMLGIGFYAWRERAQNQRNFYFIIGLFSLVIFQAVLGKLTVTEKLNPAIVTSHLLIGFLTFSLFARYYFVQHFKTEVQVTFFIKILALLTLILAILQIFLGGWTSSNYAAIVCYDFPMCYDQQWLPKSNFAEAFRLWRGSGIDYEGGVLDQGARISIHMSHRLGAVIVGISTVTLALMLLFKTQSQLLRNAGLALLVLVLIQIGLGISVVFMSRPLLLAVAHNGVAALLFMLLFIVYFHCSATTVEPVKSNRKSDELEKVLQ